MSETRNAVIRSVYLGFEDHGLLTLMLDLDYGGTGQGFGNYNLGAEDAGNYCARWIKGLLKTFEIDELYKLKGKNCRAVATDGGVLKIGHIVKDQWFDPEQIKDHSGLDEQIERWEETGE